MRTKKQDTNNNPNDKGKQGEDNDYKPEKMSLKDREKIQVNFKMLTNRNIGDGKNV